ncbi:hypothetical protein KMX18_004687 [Salmonella enterica]|nr:hypothetical protein [Salmonella enterica]EHP5915746.1 hypothetical protein [Salmonella enterica]
MTRRSRSSRIIVTCKTSHQLAYAATGRFFASRLVSNLKVTDVARALNSKNWRLARAVLYTLNHFICSADAQITAIHAPDEEELPDTERAQAVTAAQRLWLMMTARQENFPVTHDTYLKLYQLSRPDLSSRYSTLLFDEAQDANPVTQIYYLAKKRFFGISEIFNFSPVFCTTDDSSYRYSENIFQWMKLCSFNSEVFKVRKMLQ